MSRHVELCCDCGRPTGKAGRGEDSLYLADQLHLDDAGPFCEECYESARELWGMGMGRSFNDAT